VSAPILGGVLTDRLSWRACFYLNLPLGAIALAVLAYFFQNPRINPNEGLPFREKIGKLDLLGTAIFVPSCTSLLLALQWGGAKYGWGNVRIIVLLVVFVVLLVAFGYHQYRQGDNAMLPPRILKNRSIVAGAWFAGCSNASLAVVEYYMAIYLQAVKEYSAQKSGFMMLPQVIGLCIAGLAAGVLTSSIGYYARKASFSDSAGLQRPPYSLY
jgi:MFS family permease